MDSIISTPSFFVCCVSNIGRSRGVMISYEVCHDVLYVKANSCGKEKSARGAMASRLSVSQEKLFS